MTGNDSMLPIVSVIIPVRPGGDITSALISIRGADYPADRIEIIAAEGCNPARQRNVALRAARGEIVYFLDDDSELTPQTLRRAVDVLRPGGTAAVGGPVLTHSWNTQFQRAVGLALGSVVGLGPYRARYRAIGTRRLSHERELTSANLAVTRDILGVSGGFDERLFGNEENEWLSRLQRRGATLYYDPLILCYRSQRSGLAELCQQHFHYGRGRGRHLLIRGYGAVLGISIFALALLGLLLSVYGFRWLAGAAALYLLVIVVSGALVSRQSARRPLTFAHLICIYPTIHAGFLAGLLYGTLQWVFSPVARARCPGDDLEQVRVHILQPVVAQTSHNDS